MKKFNQLFTILSAAAIFATGCDKNNNNDYPAPQPTIQSTVFTATGNPDAINIQLNDFRNLIGEHLNTAPDQVGGRREVNWDGVPANFVNNDLFPFDFFNNTEPLGPNQRKKGFVFLNTGTSFRIDSSSLKDIDLSYEDEFPAFSKKKVVIASSSTISEGAFKIPGTTTDASVKAFGVVFVDVDDANSTTVEFFNGTKSLGVFKAPAKAGSGEFSFLGVLFPQEKITRVKINSGNAVLAAGIKDVTDGGTKDLVAFDDFIYDEPKVNN